MKSSTIVVFLTSAFGFMASSCLFAQTKSQKLTERISISFPGEYSTRETGPATLYNLRLADSTANFVVVVSDLLKSNGLDAATLAAASMEPEFWDQAAESFLAQMGAEAKLKNREMKNVNGYDIMELTFERPNTEKGGINTITVYILVDDVYSLNIIHTNRSGKADETLKKAFFDSLTIK
jgi:hypothetical protein